MRSGWEHFVRFGRDEGRRGLPPPGQETVRLSRAHRQEAARHAAGAGLEVGALERACPVAPDARVTYCDRFTVEEARAVINGLTDVPLTEVHQVVDLDTDGLEAFATESQDFSILCNVLQLVANPIRVLGEAFRVVKPGGHVVLSVPDHRFAFEASRPVTPFDHVLDEYLQGVTTVTDAHFVDLLVLFYPSEVALGVSAVAPRLAQLRRRLEHAHVWDSMGFAELVKRGLRVVDVEATAVFEATGDDTRTECFVILRKDRQLVG